MKILSPDIEGSMYLTFKFVTLISSLDPKLVLVMMPTCVFITITNIMCTYPHIQPILFPR